MTEPLSPEQIRAKARPLFWRNFSLACLGILAAYLIVLATYNTALIRQGQDARAPLIQETHHTAQLIASCTTPGRPCYERAQRQTASAVGSINLAIKLAASCASGPRHKSVAQISACVHRLIRIAASHR